MLFGKQHNEILELEKSNPKKFCTKILKNKNNRNYADIMYFSDQHIGSIFCDFSLIKKQRDRCLKEHIYVKLGGDLIEGSTRFSVGAGIYEQNLTPHEQLFALISFLKPLADADLLISVCMGNHDERFKKVVGIDIISIISYILKVPYLGFGGFNYLKIGNQNYISYLEHGNGSSKVLSSKMKKVIDASKNIDNFDVFAWGHTHELFAWKDYRQNYNKKNKSIELIEKQYLLTGSYLNYDFSYANASSLPPARLGSPILRFYGNQHKVEVLEPR